MIVLNYEGNYLIDWNDLVVKAWKRNHNGEYDITEDKHLKNKLYAVTGENHKGEFLAISRFLDEEEEAANLLIEFAKYLDPMFFYNENLAHEAKKPKLPEMGTVELGEG